MDEKCDSLGWCPRTDFYFYLRSCVNSNPLTSSLQTTHTNWLKETLNIKQNKIEKINLVIHSENISIMSSELRRLASMSSDLRRLPSMSSELRRLPSMRNSAVSNSSKTVKRRKSKWSDVPEDEKREILRQRNNANLRKNRDKRKKEEVEDRMIFEENEKRISHLESMVQDLESELRRAWFPFPRGRGKETKLRNMNSVEWITKIL